MAFPAGKLNHRYRLQSRAQTRDGDAGALVDLWTTEATIWGGREVDYLPQEKVIGAAVTPSEAAFVPVRRRVGLDAGKRLIRERDATTISGAINATVTTVVLARALEFNGGVIDYLAIDNEILRVTAGGSGTTLTVERGAIETTPASHANGAKAVRVEKLEIWGVERENELDDEVYLRVSRVG